MTDHDEGVAREAIVEVDARRLPSRSRSRSSRHIPQARERAATDLLGDGPRPPSRISRPIERVRCPCMARRQ
jgi:hypothetical protein